MHFSPSRTFVQYLIVAALNSVTTYKPNKIEDVILTYPNFNRYFRAFWTRRPATTPCKHHVYQIKKWIQEKILISNIRKAFEIK